MARKRILFLSIGNSCRSQMAEGLLRNRAGDRFEVHSAGVQPETIRPEAIAVMAEIGIDISGQRSKSVNEFDGQEFAYAITVCDSSSEGCPLFSGIARYRHWSFEDPAAAVTADEERIAPFRQLRDEIAARIRSFVAEQSLFRCAAYGSFD